MRKKKLFAMLLSATLLTGLLSGCDQKAPEPVPHISTEDSSQEETLEQVTLKWYVVNNGPQAGTEAVEDAVNEYLKDTLNVKLDLIEYDWGSYEEKVRMAIASGEEFDLCYTSDWCNNFYSNVSKNAFYELDELLAQYGQGIQEFMPQAGWDAATVGGKIYAVPNYQNWFRQCMVGGSKAVLDNYDFDLNTVKSPEDLEPLLAQMKADNPDMYPICNGGQAGIAGKYLLNKTYDPIAGQGLPVAVDLTDTSYQVYNPYATDEYLQFCTTMYEWNQKGYFRRDSATMSEDDARSDAKSGKTALSYWVYKPGILESYFNDRYGTSCIYATTGDPIITTGSITATLTAISRTSKHPERAMMFLNAVNTDPYLYNLLCFGIQGVHYTLDETGTYAIPVENSGYDPNIDWEFGNQFHAYLREGQDADLWEQTMAINESAVTSVACGFSFDITPVSAQMTAIQSVMEEYETSLQTGTLEPASGIAEMNAKLEAAGLSDVLAEAQRQIDQWATENKTKTP